MSPKLPHPTYTEARTLRCCVCRYMRAFAAGEKPAAHCTNCNEKRHFHDARLDTLMPLNRSDLVFIGKTLNEAYCGHKIEGMTKEDHDMAHRLMNELDEHNPSDLPLHEPTGGGPGQLLSMFFGMGDDVKIIDLTNPQDADDFFGHK